MMIDRMWQVSMFISVMAVIPGQIEHLCADLAVDLRNARPAGAPAVGLWPADAGRRRLGSQQMASS